MSNDQPAGSRDPRSYPTWSVRLADGSRPYLLRLQAMPRSVLLIATLVLLLGGLFLPGVAGAVLLAILGVFLLWLALLAWPMIGSGGRLARLGVAVVVLAYAIAKAIGLV